MKLDNLTSGIKRVMVVFLIVFFVLISYLSYFVIFTGPKIVTRTDNKRLWDTRYKVLRGTIYDRNGKALSESQWVGENKQKRVYNAGPTASHVLGYFDEKYGITGLENLYDSHLSNSYSTTFWYALENKFKPSEKKGDNVYSTLDMELQNIAYNALGDNRGSVVAIHIKTGEILTMVSKPSYDPNNLDKSWSDLNKNPNRPLLNRSVSGLYPPGSTFKVLTAASGLENIPNLKNETFNDSGKLKIGPDYTLSNDSGAVYGNINLEQALIKSSNVFFGDLGIRLGKNLYGTAEKFMFNKDIKADGIIIDKSRFPKYTTSQKGNMAQSAIGQAEVLATPVQMALVAQAIANDGLMVSPTLISKVIAPDGKELKYPSVNQIGQVTSKENADIIGLAMKNTVAYGTGTRAQVSGVNVCGKTGTAQNAEGPTPHSWFIGYAPYEEPEIAIAVIVEQGGYGSVAAAQITSQVLNKYFSR